MTRTLRQCEVCGCINDVSATVCSLCGYELSQDQSAFGYAITLSTHTHGNVTGVYEDGTAFTTGDVVPAGTGLILTATPDAHYKHTSWTISGATNNGSTLNPVLIRVTGTCSIVCIFTAQDVLTLGSYSHGVLTITYYDNGVLKTYQVDEGGITKYVDNATTVSYTVTENAGYVMTSLSNGTLGVTSGSFTMAATYTLTPVFSTGYNGYKVVITANGSTYAALGTGTVDLFGTTDGTPSVIDATNKTIILYTGTE